MNNIKNAKWLLFDFGGCLDSDGVHSRTLFLKNFKKHNLLSTNDQFNFFQEAYTFSDQEIINKNIVKDMHLLKMNEIICSIICQKLKILNKSSLIEKTAISISCEQSHYLNRNKFILEKLSKNYKLGIISNFSGNLKKILQEHSLSAYFDFILDSYHVGHCKPKAEIFNLAISKCNEEPDNIFYIGDNEDRDILPAKALGLKTVLISSKHIFTNADYILTSVEELLELTQQR